MASAAPPMPKVFVSSTVEDLSNYRDAVFEAIERSGVKAIGSDQWERVGPIAESTQDLIAASDAFVGIYAHRYGPTDTDSGLSSTEMEYQYARRLGKPILAFAIHPDASWSPQFVDSGADAAALERFKDALYSEGSVEQFSTPEDLAQKVVAMLQDLFPDVLDSYKPTDSAQQSAPPISEVSVAAAKQRVWWFYADGKVDDQIEILKDRDEIASWGANPHTEAGDMILMYRTEPYSDLAYIFQTSTPARERSPGSKVQSMQESTWTSVADLTNRLTLDQPITHRDLAEHPAFEDWGFAKRPQGALRWTQDLRQQDRWEALRGLILALNPGISTPLAAMEQIDPAEMIEAAMPVAEQIPEESRRQAALSNLQSLRTPDEEIAPDDAKYQPQPRVSRDYWTADDTLGLEPYADAIAAFVRHDESRPPLTIGIKAPWGAGKTSLMRMVQARLDPPVNKDEPKWSFPELQLTKEAKERLSSDTDTDSASAAKRSAKDTVTLRTVRVRLGTASTEPPDLRGIEATDVAADVENTWRPTVWFNPWMYQTGEEVWAGLAYEVIEQITGRLERRDRNRFWLELNLRRVDRDAVRRKILRLAFEKILPTTFVVLVFGLLLTFGAAQDTSGLGIPFAAGTGVAWVLAVGIQLFRLFNQDASTALPSLVTAPQMSALRGSLTRELEGTVDEFFPEPDYQSKAGFLHLVQTDIRHVLDLVATPDRPLVIFVDDLDRCSPGVVAQTIEAINLFLAGEFPNCMFVLAVEPAVVAAHVEVAHEKLVERLRENALCTQWSTLGWRFLEKIVQLPLSLPRPDSEQTSEYLRSLFGQEEKTEERQPPPPSPTEQAARENIMKRLEKEEPTLDVLPGLIDQAVADLTEDEASSVRGDVVATVFDRFFKDSDPTVQEILAKEAFLLPSRNAREIKRLLNLFRFYSFIAARRRLLDVGSSESQKETLEKVAKLGSLAIQFPFLLDTLSQPTEPPSEKAPKAAGEESAESKTDHLPALFEKLETAAPIDENWSEVIEEYGLVRRDSETGILLEPPDWLPGFRSFLNREPKLATFVRRFV